MCKKKEILSALDQQEEKERLKKEEMAREQAIAKVMRVTVDKLAEDNEREERQSPLVQIQLTKKAVSSISQEQNKRFAFGSCSASFNIILSISFGHLFIS